MATKCASTTLLPIAWTSLPQSLTVEFSPMKTFVLTSYRSHRGKVGNAASLHLKSVSHPSPRRRTFRRLHASAVGTSTVAKNVHVWNTSVASANAPGISSANAITFATIAPIPNTIRSASHR